MSAPSRPVAGVLWMVLTGLLFVGVTATVKHLGDRVPAPQAAFLRYVLGLFFLLPLWRQIAGAPFDARHLRLYAGRGVLHAIGVSMWFYAMTRIPIAEVTALNYLSPIYITIGAALFLGERFSWPRMVAILAALVGVALILRPGFRAVDLGHLAMLGTALLFAGSYLIAKVLSDEVKPSIVVAMLSIWTTVGLAPMALAVWVWPSWDELGWLFLVASLATTGHFTMTLAFQSAPISVTQPITFLQLVWATLVGWWVFSEGIDAFVVAGGAIIVGSVVVISIREARQKRRTPPVAL
ncbi:Riboflavin transporter [Rhodobacteraceae bacterium THAF1]|uniref:DMT family transporter n=1 Tax=Palleronia sp. THAF1 TaxID=2587842 RepID=UPI000F3AC249|nr:DMT family transporter [Palleronia sp. THAF1]QFU07979.1 Riboflavin transporter [Palleronia sp. THAF1]VDC27830.1 Riboflavin transporter [Rhodobacteraceae bacterium THAF1]